MQVLSVLSRAFLFCFEFVFAKLSWIKSAWLLLTRKSKVTLQKVFPSAFLCCCGLVSASANARDFEPRYWYQTVGAQTLYASPQAAFEAYKAWEENNNLSRPASLKITVLDFFVQSSSYLYNGKPSAYSFHFSRPEDCPQSCEGNFIGLVTECPRDSQARAQIITPGQSLRFYCFTPDETQRPDPSLCIKTPKPILLTTGAKETIETDFIASGAFPLRFVRTYRSDRGGKWSHNHELYGFNLAATINTNSASAVPERACVQGIGADTGETYCFKYMNSGQPNDFGVLRSNDRKLSFGTTTDLSPAADINDRVTPITDSNGATIAWQVRNAANDSTERYDLTGRIQTVTSLNGLVQTYTYADGTTGPNGGFILDASGNSTTEPLPLGLLIRVTDASTRSLQFAYNTKKQMVQMLDPGNQRYAYEYDINSNLSKVTYPDNKTKQYLYGEVAYTSGANLPNSLTGIIDENGVRHATYRYDTQGRAYDEDHGPNMPSGPVDHYGIIYDIPNVKTTVTNPLGSQHTYNFTTILGVVKSTGTNQPGGSGCGPAASNMTYDANGNIKTRTDFNGNTTWFDYDLSRNLETVRIEAYATPLARTINTAWHPNFRLPTAITEPGRITEMSYDPVSGNMLSRKITSTSDAKVHQWTYTYTTASDGTLPNLLKSADGPRTDISDVTSYTYYPNGDLQSVSNALSHVTQITSYDPHGRPLTMLDPNSLSTTLTYWPRGWLKTRSVGAETTSYDYDSVGQIKKITLPSGAYIRYDYEDAHRLTDIWDQDNNRIHYTLDAMGNRTQEDTYDALGAKVATKNRTFDALSRLFQEIDAVNASTGIRPTTTYGYDANGNQTWVQAPNLATTSHNYDALHRLFKTTDALSGITQYGYDGVDQLISVKDPRNLITNYSVNALGDQTQLTSPDTGITNKTYDEAGNLRTSIDARNQQTTYTYDALNRVTGISYTSGAPIGFSYDQGINGKGRLTGMSDESGSTQWGYDAQGRVVTKTATTGGLPQVLRYRYDPQGRLDQITYPSGKIVALAYLANKISSISADNQPVLSGVQYHPFSGPKLWYFGNNSLVNRNYDQSNRLYAYNLGNATRNLSFDDTGRISNIADSINPGLTQNMGYDNLDRLTSWVTGTGNQSFGYDANSNRTNLTLGATSYSSTIATSSNRLNAISGPTAKTYGYDNAGNIQSDSKNTFNYNARGRLQSVANSSGTETYLVNGLGQRVVKSGLINVRFVFDEGGRLIGEYTPSGALIQETVYLGDLPVAVLR